MGETCVTKCKPECIHSGSIRAQPMHSPLYIWLLLIYGSFFPFIARQCFLPTVKTGKYEHTESTQNNIFPSPETSVPLKRCQSVGSVSLLLGRRNLNVSLIQALGPSVLIHSLLPLCAAQASCASWLLVPLAALWVLWQKQRRRRKRRMKTRMNSSGSPRLCSSSSASVSLPGERCRRSLERSPLSFRG